MSSRYVQHPMEKSFADYEKEKRRKGMAEAMKKHDDNLIADCGCRFESDNSNAVILCAKCSELPCHNR
jgi:hypothetical protein